MLPTFDVNVRPVRKTSNPRNMFEALVGKKVTLTFYDHNYKPQLAKALRVVGAYLNDREGDKSDEWLSLESEDGMTQISIRIAEIATIFIEKESDNG